MQQPRIRRPRPRAACDTCHSRKVKCDGQSPCDRCIRGGRGEDCLITISNSWVRKRTHPSNKIAPSPRGSGPLSRSDDYNNSPSSSYGIMTPPASATSHIVKGTSDSHTVTPTISLSDEPVRKKHKLTDGSVQRGHSHFMWLLREFDTLMIHAEEAGRTDRTGRKVTFLNHKAQIMRHRKLSMNPVNPLGIFHELPEPDTARDLLNTFLGTFGSVFPILDHDSFYNTHEAILRDPPKANISSLILVLLVHGIGNIVLNRVSKEKTRGWLGLASAWQSTILETGHFDLQITSIFFLITLARHLECFVPNADWMAASHGVRSARAIGLDSEATGCERELWNAIVELDLQTALAAGLLPAGNYDEACPRLSDQDTLARSHQVRFKIVQMLNCGRDFSHDQMSNLSRELTIQMSQPGSEQFFLREFVAFTYRKFLFSLHIPFVLEQSMGFDISQNVCSSLSLQLVQTICSTPEDKSDFQSLLFGNGTIFKVESFKAIMLLCLGLLRKAPSNAIVDPVIFSHMPERQAIKSFISVAEESLRMQEHAAKSFLIPSMTLAYLQILESRPERELDALLAEAAVEISARCFSAWVLPTDGVAL